MFLRPQPYTCLGIECSRPVLVLGRPPLPHLRNPSPLTASKRAASPGVVCSRRSVRVSSSDASARARPLRPVARSEIDLRVGPQPSRRRPPCALTRHDRCGLRGLGRSPYDAGDSVTTRNKPSNSSLYGSSTISMSLESEDLALYNICRCPVLTTLNWEDLQSVSSTSGRTVHQWSCCA